MYVDLPSAVWEMILELLDGRGRVTLTSVNSRLLALGAASPHLWTPLALSLSAKHMVALACWLRARALDLKELSITIIQPDLLASGALKQAVITLAGAPSLTSLRISYAGHPPQGPGHLLEGGGFNLPQLRRLELHSEGLLEVVPRFTQLTSLTSLALGGGCRPTSAFLVSQSLRQLEMPYEIGPWGSGGFDVALRDAARVRDLRLSCQGLDPEQALDGVYSSFAEEDSLDLGILGALTPQLESLAVDCTQVSQGGGRELALAGGEGLPRTLRALAVTHLGHSSLPFLLSLPAQSTLARLRLPRCRLVGAPMLLEGFTALEELSLEGTVGSSVGRTLCPLRTLPVLRRLSLASCDLRQLGPGGLAGGWPALQELRADHAWLPQRWAPVLCGALQQQHFTRLSLDIEQAAEAAPWLSDLASLRRLDVYLLCPPVPGQPPSLPTEDSQPYPDAHELLRHVVAAVGPLPRLSQVGVEEECSSGKGPLRYLRQALEPLEAKRPAVEIVALHSAEWGEA